MRIEWSPLAVTDRSNIFDYIEAENPLAAITVDERIEAQVDQLIAFPESGRIGRVEGTRELVVSRTPYLVAYRITADVVLILRILHNAQRWPNELP
jgi:toxin ParE1/3/4